MPNFISEDQIEQALLQRLQHVCGFDVLECHTTDPADLNDGSSRLDKPMKDHTLMQTIARVNRVTPWQINGVEKRNGEIVDCYNVFRNMKKALRDYAQGEGGLDEPPVRDKAALFALMDDAAEQALAYCAASGIGLREVLAGDNVFAKIGRFNEFANTLLGSDELRRTFYVYENTVSALYEACKPEVLGHGKVHGAGGSSTEQYFEQLVQFSQELRSEDERHVREGLTEDELEIFDLLCKVSMTQAETKKVKLAAKALLHRLQDESPRVLVQDWYQTDQTRRIVRSAVAEVLDRELPQESYDRALFQTKCDNIFHLVLDCAAQGRKWAA